MHKNLSKSHFSTYSLQPLCKFEHELRAESLVSYDPQFPHMNTTYVNWKGAPVSCKEDDVSRKDNMALPEGLSSLQRLGHHRYRVDRDIEPPCY